MNNGREKIAKKESCGKKLHESFRQRLSGVYFAFWKYRGSKGNRGRGSYAGRGQDPQNDPGKYGSRLPGGSSPAMDF